MHFIIILILFYCTALNQPGDDKGALVTAGCPLINQGMIRVPW